MPESILSILGFSGSVTAACLFLPQVWSSHRTKKTKQIAWTSYGFLKHDLYIYVTNTLCFGGAFLLLLLKKKHG